MDNSSTQAQQLKVQKFNEWNTYFTDSIKQYDNNIIIVTIHTSFIDRENTIRVEHNIETR